MGAFWAPGQVPAGAMTSLDGFLAETVSVAAVLVSDDGTVLRANPAHEELFGAVTSIHDVVVPGQAALLTGLLTGAGPVLRSGQMGLVRSNGDVIDCKIWAVMQEEGILVLAEPLRLPAEQLNALLLELNDDLLAARHALSTKNRRLRELDDLKSMFLASAAHDLRTPLTSILGYAELLGDQSLPGEAHQMAQTIENSALRVLTMINDLLGAATIMTGELKLERTPADVVPIVREAIEGFRPVAESAEVTITRKGAGSAPALVDERRVRQILDNLLSNAIKYCHAGGQVTVTCSAGEDSVQVSVADTGIGIPAAEQQKLFGRYFRASTAVEHGIPGTGLGLANAHAFAEAHGGSLTCVSEPGVGSTFTVTLPSGRTGE